MKNFILTTTLAAVLVSTANADIQYAKSVPKDQKKLLTADMFFLANQPYAQDPKLSQLMGISSTDGLTILNWVDNRMSRIVDENFELDKNIYVISQSYFPQPAETPTLPTVVNNPDTSGGTVKTIMSNLGGAIYVAAKIEHMSFGIKIDDKKIDVTSPRIGIFKVGTGLFDSQAILKQPPESIISRYFRIATLVHEARHSDGRGKSAAFFHAICPTGRYAGYAACDANSNGPYSIEAQFIKLAAQTCKECQPGELEMINKLAADSFSRTVTPAPDTIDAQLNSSIISSYQLLLSICQKSPGSCSPEDLKKYQDAIAKAQGAMAGTTATTEAPAWDATPEGTYPTISRDQTWTTIYLLNQQLK